uniref:P-loop containing nucleoside triphosphate hydrolase protein n=1 Tax=Angiostrongylus cantonensis TaxID=6313 RepID=A0A0K0D191_ANGCA
MARNERKENRTKLARSKSAARARAPNTGRDVGRRPYEITVVVLGGTRVGKSALVSQFLWNSFPTDYRPTVDEFNWVEYDIGDGSLLMLQINYLKRAQRMIVGPLQIIDSSGSHDFLAMRHFYIRTGDAFMVRIVESAQHL